MDFQKRVKNLQNIFLKKNLDGLLISSIPNIIYLTGFSNFVPQEREGFLLITKSGSFYFTNALYIEEVSKRVHHFKPLVVTREKPFKKILLEDFAKKLKIKRIGFEPYNITISEYKNIKNSVMKLVPSDFTSIRLIKEPPEIRAIQKACELGDKAFDFILSKLKPGVTEKEVAFELEVFVKKAGGDLSFNSVVAFGKNSSMIHYQPSSTKLKPNSFVLMDFGVKINNYCSDMSRTVFVGKATKEQKKMYQAVLDAQKKAVEKLDALASHSSTISGKEIDKVARDHIVSQGFDEFPHGLGHGIGILVHEPPYLSSLSKSVLKENMVFSIEPGVYIPNVGGVRIEDLVVLEKSGAKLLTKAPRHLIEL